MMLRRVLYGLGWLMTAFASGEKRYTISNYDNSSVVFLIKTPNLDCVFPPLYPQATRNWTSTRIRVPPMSGDQPSIRSGVFDLNVRSDCPLYAVKKLSFFDQTPMQFLKPQASHQGIECINDDELSCRVSY